MNDDFMIDIQLNVRLLWKVPPASTAEQILRDQIEGHLTFCASRLAGEFRDILDTLLRAQTGTR